MTHLPTIRARYLAPGGPTYLSTEQVVEDIRGLVERVETLEADNRAMDSELFMWHHSQCYCCRTDESGRCNPGCRCHPEHPDTTEGE